jgi:hypothetical protein
LLRLQKQKTYFFEITTDSDLIISEKYAIMRKRFVGEERGENGKKAKTANWHRKF